MSHRVERDCFCGAESEQDEGKLKWSFDVDLYFQGLLCTLHLFLSLLEKKEENSKA